MDDTEDLSARVLLRQIVNTEPSRTPVTRSVSQKQSTNTATRHSRRLSQKNAALTPQAILRRSLKNKLTETMTRKSLPAPQRRTSAAVLRKDPVSTSMLFDDEETPRHILRKILQTEPGRSPMVHDGGPSEEQEPPSGTSSMRKRPSIDLSSLDLPDVTIGNVMSTARVLRRKRPRRSLNVTAFEKRLRGADDAEDKSEESLDDQLSLSSLSSTSLSLKTPFADPQTEKKGLQRKVSQRRQVSVEEFGAAVNKRQMGGMHSLVSEERNLNDTTYAEGFSLGLSKLSEPDLTTDIVNCNTALYPQPDATISDASIVATQDKPTVTASQLETDLEQVGLMEAERSQRDENAPEDLCHGGEDVMEQNDGHVSQSLVAAGKVQEEEEVGVAHGEPPTCVESTSEDKEGVADSQPKSDGEEVAAESLPEEDVDTGSKSDEEKNAESEEKEETEADDESHEAAETENNEDLPENEPESRPQEDAEMESQEEETVPDSAEEEGEADGHESLLQNLLEPGHQTLHHSEEEEDGKESQDEDDGGGEDEEQREPAAEHISRRSRHSQGALVQVTEIGEDAIDSEAAGLSIAYSKANQTFSLQMSLELEEPSVTSAENPDQAESSNPEQGADNDLDADKENSLRALESGDHLSGILPEEAGPEDADEQAEWHEEEEEEEEDDNDGCDDLPSKTPAFVKVKRSFSYPGPLVSSALKNLQADAGNASDALPPTKPKQVRQRTKRPAQKKTTLPKSYLMSVFKHFAKTKVSADVYPILDEVMDSFFGRLARDLETYAAHAKRKTIEVEDAVLLLKRQGYVNDKVPVEVLIEKYLRLEQRKLLIPIATSGNMVVPGKR
ncbi:unnamed protein product [Ophioblennius macclurei]